MCGMLPWLPYPRLSVAELKPPAKGETFWDFSRIDPMMEDFMNATGGHSVVINFSTMPAWMFKTAKPVSYPDNPEEVYWNYTQGTEFRDPSMKEVADYYARLLSWYTRRGGFVDELGKRHESGHHYNIAYWEALNEIDLEHHLTAGTIRTFLRCGCDGHARCRSKHQVHGNLARVSHAEPGDVRVFSESGEP